MKKKSLDSIRNEESDDKWNLFKDKILYLNIFFKLPDEAENNIAILTRFEGKNVTIVELYIITLQLNKMVIINTCTCICLLSPSHTLLR